MKDLTTVKQRKATTVQDSLGKCLTEPEMLNQWTEYCTVLHNHDAKGDPLVLDCPQTDTEDDHPIFRREVEAVVQSLKKRKSAGVDTSQQNGPSRWGGYNHRSHDNLRQDLADRRMANSMDPVLSHHTSQERQPAAVPDLLNNKPHQSLKQSHADDHTEQIEATSGEDHRRRTGRLQSRKEYHRADLQPTHSM